MNSKPKKPGRSALRKQAGDNPAPESSEAAWDSWVQEVCATEFTPWWADGLKSQTPPFENQLHVSLTDD